MKRRELLALLLTAVGPWLVLQSLIEDVAEHLPGAWEARRWMVAWLGMGDISALRGTFKPAPIGRPGCAMYFAFLMGGVAFVLWTSARRDRRRVAAQLRERSDWSVTALRGWIRSLLEAAAEGDAALNATCERGRQAIRPYLVDSLQPILERSLDRLTDPTSARRAPVTGAPPRGRWPSVVVAVLLIWASIQLVVGALFGAAFSSLDEAPILGMPLGPSVVFQGVAPWWTGAVATSFFAWGLWRLERTAIRGQLAADRARPRLILGLGEDLVEFLKRLRMKHDLADSEATIRRAASALATALLEETPPDSRRDLVEAIYQGGFLRSSGCVSLRGATLDRTDCSGVAWPGIDLSGTSLARASFDEALLEGADLSDCSLEGATFHRARCAEARLRGSDLKSARLQRADFRDADLSGCDLTHALLWEAELSSADLRDATLDGPASARAPESATPDRSSAGFAVGSLISLHCAVLVLAPMSYLWSRYAGIPLGWFPAPTNREEEVYSSLLGFVLLSTVFILPAASMIALAWALRKAARLPSEPAAPR